jgi:hypothetical protein
MNFPETMRGLLRKEGLALPSDPKRPDWMTGWREVVALTQGVTAEDPRQPAILDAIKQCNTAFEAGDWPAFQRASAAVRQALKGRT